MDEDENDKNKDIDVVTGDGTEIDISTVYDHIILDKPEKKNKNLIIAIVIIAVIALGLGGYVVYNKMSNKPEEPKQSERPNTNDNTANEDDGNFECVLEDLSGEILKYPTKNDDSVTMKGHKTI